MSFSGRRHGVLAALGAGLVLATAGAGAATSGPPAPPAGAAPVPDQRAAAATERPGRPTEPTFAPDGRRAFAPARVLVEPRAGVGAAWVGEVAGQVGVRVDRGSVLPDQGRFAFSGRRVGGHADHRVVDAGADGVAAAGASPARRVSVRVAVSRGLDTRALPLTVSRNGAVVLRRTLRLAESRYAFTCRPTRLGSYSLTVRRSADGDHWAQVSPRRSLRVVR